MRTWCRILCLAALPLTPLQAQVSGAPPSTRGGPAQEATLSILPPRNPGSPLDAGAAAAFRRAGRVNVALRMVHWGSRSQHTSAEFGTFDALPQVLGIRTGWSAGLGYDSGRRGVFLPVGMDLARDFSTGGWHTTPFVHVGASLDGIAPGSGHAGDLVPLAEIGAEVRVRPGWSLRTALGSQEGGQFAVGMAFRR